MVLHLSIIDLLEKIEGFSSAKYEELSPYYHVNPSLCGEDIGHFQFDRVYILADPFETVMITMRFYQVQFGLLFDIFNEDWVSHFFTIVCPPHVSLIRGTGCIIDPFQRRTTEQTGSYDDRATCLIQKSGNYAFRRNYLCGAHRRTVSRLESGSRLESENELEREGMVVKGGV